MKICEILRREDIGDMGIGAMIVFIAMVLVAGIAASVLVQTANRLEMQAMQTGQQTTAEVATGIKVIDIEGQKTLRPIHYNATTGLTRGGLLEDWLNETRMQNMTITVAPRAGSLDIDLSQAVIEISDSTSKCILRYDDTETNYAELVADTGIFGTAVFDLGPDRFGIIKLEDADVSASASAPVINRGDKVMLTINLSACFLGLTERTDIWGMVIPEDGAPGIFAFRTPVAYTSEAYDLY